VLAESKGSEMFGLNFQFFPQTMGQNGKLLAEKQTHTHYFKSTALGTNYVTPRTAFMWVAHHHQHQQIMAIFHMYMGTQPGQQ